MRNAISVVLGAEPHKRCTCLLKRLPLQTEWRQRTNSRLYIVITQEEIPLGTTLRQVHAAKEQTNNPWALRRPSSCGSRWDAPAIQNHPSDLHLSEAIAILNTRHPRRRCQSPCPDSQQ